jgi:hypothetical protein
MFSAVCVLDVVHDGSANSDLMVSSQDEAHHLFAVQDTGVGYFGLPFG